MIGEVDDFGRALLVVDVRAPQVAESTRLTAWIDTAFTGELVIPLGVIRSLGLPESAAVPARLADGSEVVLESFTCVVSWFGISQVVEVIANDGEFPLLGIGLLMGRRLEIDYKSRKIVVD